ncbi:MAG TPA: phosphatase PAP2 family protein [Gaiellales bacterium]|nr:phosphatase PAP2 family protein [Gaiellales bacterium]
MSAARRQRVLDRVVIEYSALGNRGFLWVVAGAVVGIATQRWWAIPLVAGVVWVTLGLNYALKRGVRRERPLERRGRAPLIVAPASPSFPSSHAAMAAAGAMALSVYAPAFWPLFATLAVLMAASRVYLAVHHVSDVVAGLAVGASAGAAFALLAG